jgi:hypothetical protein
MGKNDCVASAGASSVLVYIIFDMMVCIPFYCFMTEAVFCYGERYSDGSKKDLFLGL